jgi:hypothetical protein
MTVQIPLPDDLAARIDDVTADRTAFVEAAVRRMLSESTSSAAAETAKIDDIAEELNREAEDVLAYQTLS